MKKNNLIYIIFIIASFLFYLVANQFELLVDMLILK